MEIEFGTTNVRAYFCSRTSVVVRDWNSGPVNCDYFFLTNSMQLTKRILSDFSLADSVELIVVQHIREDTAALIAAMSQFNIPLKKLYGINYSVDDNALQKIPKSVPLEITDYAEISKAISDTVVSNSGKFIVVDVGGYGLEVLSSTTEKHKILGAVEETNQGLWRYKNGAPKHPIVQVAQCRSKKIENVIVGGAVANGVRKVATILNENLAQKRVGILGFGEIGSNAAKALRTDCAEVYAYDHDPIQQMLSFANGFGAKDKIDFLQNCDVIVGCSGADTFADGSGAALNSGTLLISGSSKQIEFSTIISNTEFRSTNDWVKTNNEGLRLVYDGEPINFPFGSLPIEIGDYMFALLFSAIKELVNGVPLGIHELSADVQLEVSELWLDLYR